MKTQLPFHLDTNYTPACQMLKHYQQQMRATRAKKFFINLLHQYAQNRGEKLKNSTCTWHTSPHGANTNNLIGRFSKLTHFTGRADLGLSQSLVKVLLYFLLSWKYNMCSQARAKSIHQTTCNATNLIFKARTHAGNFYLNVFDDSA